jgi:hypothetical protein
MLQWILNLQGMSSNYKQGVSNADSIMSLAAVVGHTSQTQLARSQKLMGISGVSVVMASINILSQVTEF